MNPMLRMRSAVVLSLALAGAVACSDSDDTNPSDVTTGPDVSNAADVGGADAAADVQADVEADTAADAAVDTTVDTSTDATTDAATDATTEVGTDADEDAAADTTADVPDATEPPTGPELPDGMTEVLVVAADGAVITHGDASLIVSAGALAEDTTLTVDAAYVVVDGLNAVSATYTFGPEGTAFSRAARVSLPFEGAADGVSVWWTDEGGELAPLPTWVEDGHAIAYVDHFSEGVVIRCGATDCTPSSATCDGDTLQISASSCDAFDACADATSTQDCVTVLPNATGICAVDQCEVVGCSAGFSDCDGDHANGCETNGACPAVCGNGVVEGDEYCDDGNTVWDFDGCAADCSRYPVCGDTFLDPGEECDDGNTVNFDGCTVECLLEPYCGDGTVDSGEECDDGNTTDGDDCSSTCQLEGVCGNGIVEGDEYCDDGNTVWDFDGCDADCSRYPICGDTFVDPGEQCDDGNTTFGDGCSPECLLEP